MPSGTGLGCVISDKASLSKRHIYIYISIYYVIMIIIYNYVYKGDFSRKPPGIATPGTLKHTPWGDIKLALLLGLCKWWMDILEDFEAISCIYPLGPVTVTNRIFFFENGSTLGMVPLIINPIYTLYSGYLLGISPFKGLLGWLKQLGYHPRVPAFSLPVWFFSRESYICHCSWVGGNRG